MLTKRLWWWTQIAVLGLAVTAPAVARTPMQNTLRGVINDFTPQGVSLRTHGRQS